MNLESKLTKIDDFEYTKNGQKGKQLKPILLDSNNNKWIGKEYNRISAAKELFAYKIFTYINLSEVNMPEVKIGIYENQKWILSKYIDIKDYFKKSDDFKFLTNNQSQVGILFRLLANYDGNMSNIFRDQNNKVWFIDYEYSQNFYKYDERYLLNDKKRAKKIMAFFMLQGNRKLNDFEQGISKIENLIKSNELNQNILNEFALDSGFTEKESIELSNNVIEVAQNIRQKIKLMIETWNEKTKNITYKNETNGLIKLYKARGHRCGQACAKIVLDYFGEKVPSFLELDRMLNKKYKNQLIYLSQLAMLFYNKGFDIKYYANQEKINEFRNNAKSALIKGFGDKQGREFYNSSDIDEIKKALILLQNNNLIINNQPEFNKLQDIIEEDKIIISTIDINYLNELKEYGGHHVILTCVTERNVYFHDVGPVNPQKHKKVNCDMFQKITNPKIFENNYLIISGN